MWYPVNFWPLFIPFTLPVSTRICISGLNWVVCYFPKGQKSTAFVLSKFGALLFLHVCTENRLHACMHACIHCFLRCCSPQRPYFSWSSFIPRAFLKLFFFGRPFHHKIQLKGFKTIDKFEEAESFFLLFLLFELKLFSSFFVYTIFSYAAFERRTSGQDRLQRLLLCSTTGTIYVYIHNVPTNECRRLLAESRR